MNGSSLAIISTEGRVYVRANEKSHRGWYSGIMYEVVADDILDIRGLDGGKKIEGFRY